MRPSLLALLLSLGCGGLGLTEAQQLRVSCGQATTSALFSRACLADADCAVAQHQLDCCGSEIVTGIAASELSSFESFENGCNQKRPLCACAPRPEQADDGKVLRSVGDQVAVSCLHGQCFTTVR